MILRKKVFYLLFFHIFEKENEFELKFEWFCAKKKFKLIKGGVQTSYHVSIFITLAIVTGTFPISKHFPISAIMEIRKIFCLPLLTKHSWSILRERCPPPFSNQPPPLSQGFLHLTFLSLSDLSLNTLKLDFID